MDYPLFLVPHIGGSWLIGAVAIFHVIIAHFAIGGGLLMVVTEQLGARRGNLLWLTFARKHSVFLVLLSSVLGAVSGVGIWFTVGVVQPAAVASLIHTFVWGWAIEWVLFVVEMAAALLYVGTWDRVSRRTHLAIGWIYFVTAYLSLVVINGIVTFMLTPGRWLETRAFWDGFFNPTYWPSLVLRTGIALMLAGAYGWLVATRLPRDRGRDELVRYLATWGVAGMPVAWIGFAWWAGNIPAQAQNLIFPADGLLRPTYVMGLSALALLAVLLVGVGFLAPRTFGVTTGILAVLLTGSYFGAYERVREGSRKPYVIHGYMYSNGIRVDEVDRLNREGVLTKARWAGAGVPPGPMSLGRQVFRAQCQMCHSLDGYLAIRPLVAGQDAEGLRALLEALRAGSRGMPPIIGTDTEVEGLAGYLAFLGQAAGGAR
jgi:cytochrome bd ubiquinol oxidase subunit I